MTKVTDTIWLLKVMEYNDGDEKFEEVDRSYAADLPTALAMSQNILEDTVITFKRFAGGSYILDSADIHRRVTIWEEDVHTNEWFEN